jgi:hypothetical protein
MVHVKRDGISKTSGYATSVEFCELFARETKSLYLLSLLLTAKHENAEECFVSSLEECIEGNSVFKEWAHSWAKRMIVKNAIQMIAPRLCTDKDAVADLSDVCCGLQGPQQAHRAMVGSLACNLLPGDAAHNSRTLRLRSERNPGQMWRASPTAIDQRINTECRRQTAGRFH